MTWCGGLEKVDNFFCSLIYIVRTASSILIFLYVLASRTRAPLSLRTRGGTRAPLRCLKDARCRNVRRWLNVHFSGHILSRGFFFGGAFA